MTLFCAIVGEQGDPFSVTVTVKQTVDDLKKAVKKEKENDVKAIDADKLQLFLAKQGDVWLKMQDVAAVTLDEEGQAVVQDKSGLQHSLERMDATADLADHVGSDFALARGDIHVLVVVSSPRGDTAANADSSTDDTTSANDEPRTLRALEFDAPCVGADNDPRPNSKRTWKSAGGCSLVVIIPRTKTCSRTSLSCRARASANAAC